MRKAMSGWRWCYVVLVSILVAGCGPEGIPTVSPMSTVSPTETVFPTETAIPTEQDPFSQARLHLVEKHIQGAGIMNQDVLRAMRNVPRHEFVPAEYVDQAYEDHPLPIGYGQAISQPFIVAMMTELLELQPGEKVLEIGTGSGYQAAVLAELGYVDVYSVEIVPELAETAATRLQALGYTNVHVKQGDGYFGWPEYAPFDAIIVTAAPDHLPAPLAEQLAEGGRIVIPMGPPGWYQSLWKFVDEDGELKAYNMGDVAFVSLTGSGVEGHESTPIP